MRMDPPRPARLLVDVQPRLLRDALIRILAEVALDEVFTASKPGQRFDAAVVTGSLPPGVEARLVITLPLQGSGVASGVGRVEVDGGPPQVIPVDGLATIVRLLDEYYPATASRVMSIGFHP